MIPTIQGYPLCLALRRAMSKGAWKPMFGRRAVIGYDPAAPGGDYRVETLYVMGKKILTKYTRLP